MAKVLELQFQHQSFQWLFRTDSFRINWFELFAVQETWREWQTTSAFLLWETREQYEKAKRYDTERWSSSTPAELLSPKLCYVWYLLSTQKLIVKGVWFCSDVKGFFGLAWSSETHPHSQTHTHTCHSPFYALKINLGLVFFFLLILTPLAVIVKLWCIRESPGELGKTFLDSTPKIVG